MYFPQLYVHGAYAKDKTIYWKDAIKIDFCSKNFTNKK